MREACISKARKRRVQRSKEKPEEAQLSKAKCFHGSDDHLINDHINKNYKKYRRHRLWKQKFETDQQITRKLVEARTMWSVNLQHDDTVSGIKEWQKSFLMKEEFSHSGGAEIKSTIIPDMSCWEEARSSSRTCWRDCIYLLAWCQGVPPDKLEKLAGESQVWAALLKLQPCDPALNNWKIK